MEMSELNGVKLISKDSGKPNQLLFPSYIHFYSMALVPPKRSIRNILFYSTKNINIHIIGEIGKASSQ